MGFLPREQVLARIRTDSTNSSHFIWLLDERMRFYEAAGGIIFAFQTHGSVTVLALEPLIPGAPREYPPEVEKILREAWQEFEREVRPRTAAFVSVYLPFLRVLERLGFQPLQVGQEPWVELSHCIPKGNAGKGVRSARNQAIRSGLRVEEWSSEAIEREPARRAVLEEIHHDWKSQRLVHLGGFLNATDPLAYARERRYFMLRSAAREEAFLIATPVAGFNGWFLEDLVIRRDAPRGAGELLTLEAMVALAESGATEASLGVVSVTHVDSAQAARLPAIVRFLLVTAPRYLKTIYNFDGMEIYRKRFKPHAWQRIHLAVKPGAGTTAAAAWVGTLVALVRAFRPRFQPSFGWLASALARPVRRYPLALLVAGISTLLFALVNRFGHLPEHVLARYGFTPDAPWWEWPYRSVVSDFLYFDVSHFSVWATALVAVVAWSERSHRTRFLLPFLALSCLFDDILNYGIITAPFGYFQPHMFRNLVAEKDVGGSLIFTTLFGLQICQFRRLREPLFAVVSLAMVLAFAYTSAQLHFLVMNLNHALFFVVGFLAGKVKFEHGRYVSRRAAKGKPPVGKSVLPPEKKAA